MEEIDLQKSYESMRKEYSYRLNQLKIDFEKNKSFFTEDQVLTRGVFLFHSRRELTWTLNEFQRRGVDIQPYLKELEPLDREAEEFVQHHLEQYLDSLEKDLKTTINSISPENISFSSGLFISTMDRRYGIEGSIDQLEKYHRDVSLYRKQLSVLDEELKRQVLVAIQNKTFEPDIEDPIAPKEYWWLHLAEQYGYPDEIID